MSMLKFAYSEHAVLESFTDAPKINSSSEDSIKCVAQFKNTVEAAKRVIKKSADFMYVRTRAIGSLEKWGPNMNGDAFPMKELTSSYKTFIGKGNFIDHKSDDITKIRGLVVDAFLNNGDNCVECLIAVDRKSHPQLARDIETGVVNSVSMGTRVGWSECSCCGQVARTEKDYCSHISQYKGMKVGFLTNNATHKFGKYAVHEVNHDLEFIELSWVAVPAFSDAYVLEKIASLKQGSGVVSELKTAVDAGVIGNQESDEYSDSEKEMLSFASERLTSPLQSIAEAAQCKDTECEFDARKSKSSNRGVKVAAEMNRVRIVREEIGFRTLPKDYSAKGSITLDNKNFSWWAASPDKQKWHISLDEGLSNISANGQMQIVKAITEMILKSIDNTDLVVASDASNVKNAYINNNVQDALMKKPLDEMVTDTDREIYDNKDLAPSDGNVRDVEQKAFEGTAADGPSGPLGKKLPKKDLTMNHEELELKEEYKRAFLKYLVKRRMGKVD